MLPRIYYGLRQAFQYKAILRQYLLDPTLQLATVFALNAQIITELKVKILALDYDGVLAAHGEATPRPEVVLWLQQAKAQLRVDKLYILSNKPTTQRQEYFQHNFPEMEFIVAKRKKPFPDGLQEILRLSGVKAEQILLVDDRLGTGVLAATILGAKALLLTEPYVNLRGHTFAELGIMFLRWLEKLLIKVFC